MRTVAYLILRPPIIPDMLHSIIFLIKIKCQQCKMDFSHFVCMFPTRKKHEAVLAILSISVIFWTLQFNLSNEYSNNEYLEDPEEITNSCQETQKQRQALLQKQCQLLFENRQKLDTINFSYLENIPNPNASWINYPRKMVMCTPNKVGSQTWRYFFQQLDKFDQNSGIPAHLLYYIRSNLL